MWGRVLSAASTAVTATLPSLRQAGPPQPLHLSAGRLARLAPSSAVLTVSETTILATLSHAAPPSTPSSFTPLLVDFRAKAAAVGVIPATWPRRELQPAAQEVLVSRLIDRALRPALSAPALALPPTQLTVSVLSSSRAPSAPVDVLAVNAAAAAVAASDVGARVPSVAAARVALVDGNIVRFPSEHQAAAADLAVFVAVNASGKVLSMSIESARASVEESLVVDALRDAVEAAEGILAVQDDFRSKVSEMRRVEGRSAFPRQMPRPAPLVGAAEQVEKNGVDLVGQDVLNAVRSNAYAGYAAAFRECRQHPGKAHRAAVVTRAQQSVIDAFPELSVEVVLPVAQQAAKHAYRDVLLQDGLRIDGRRFDEVRLVRCQTGVLPGEVHGSALFERGDTQVLACATVGLKNQSVRTEQYLEGGGEDKSFFVHYSFPPYSTGEYGRFAGASSRREVGHSSLAEKAIKPVLDLVQPNGAGAAPRLYSRDVTEKEDAYPYCFRLSAEVLASDGSSSMATVCAGSLAMMDAGGPVREPVAGIAMGLVTGPGFADGNEQDYTVLTDILGAEDHFGDMDLKVTGTASGVTACQLDVKPDTGLSIEVIEAALSQAKEARLEVLEKMNATRSIGRDDFPEHAPRVLEIPVDGAVAVKTLMKDRAAGLRGIEAKSSARLTFDGQRQSIRVDAGNKEACELAQKLISDALGNLEIGTKVLAIVTDVKQSYATVNIAEGNASGILHVSKMQLSPSTDGGTSTNAPGAGNSDDPENISPGKLRFPDARRFLSRGDEVEVVVLESDRSRSILRFGLCYASRRPAVPKLGDEIDAILAAGRSTSVEV